MVATPLGQSAVVVHGDRPDRRLVLGPQYDLRYAAVSPDGRRVVTGSHFSDGQSQSVRVWDGETGRPVRTLPLDGATQAVFSPDRRWLVTSTAGVGSRLWEVGTWREVRRFAQALAAFSPDGRLMAVGDALGVVRLVEPETGREVARLTGPDPVWYNPAGFTPDGTRLLAVGGGNTVGVWDPRAIRGQLKELGLDWEWPEFPPADPPAAAGPPRRVEVVAGVPASAEEKARQDIARFARHHAANPGSPAACDTLAWAYLTAPDRLRDVTAAVPLAEKADRLEPGSAIYRNTLGLAYYRTGRYADAVRTLRPNLGGQGDEALAHDLYVLAMSHHRLGEPARARDYYDWAVRWANAQRDLPDGYAEELAAFRAEAAELLVTAVGGGVEVAPPPREKKWPKSARPGDGPAR